MTLVTMPRFKYFDRTGNLVYGTRAFGYLHGLTPMGEAGAFCLESTRTQNLYDTVVYFTESPFSSPRHLGHRYLPLHPYSTIATIVTIVITICIVISVITIGTIVTTATIIIAMVVEIVVASLWSLLCKLIIFTSNNRF